VDFRLCTDQGGVRVVHLGRSTCHAISGCADFSTRICWTTPGHKSEYHFTTPSTSKVDSHPKKSPKVLETGALRRRNNVFFLYHEILAARVSHDMSHEERYPSPRQSHNHFTEMCCGYQGGLVFKAHRLLYHSAYGSRTFKDLQRESTRRTATRGCPAASAVTLLPSSSVPVDLG